MIKMIYNIRGSKARKVPTVLKNKKFATYEQARNALRKYIRSVLHNGAQHSPISFCGLNIVRRYI